MKRSSLILLLATMLLLAAGCSSAGPSANASPIASESTAPAAPSPSPTCQIDAGTGYCVGDPQNPDTAPQLRFLIDVHAAGLTLDDTDAHLLENGADVCQTLTDGGLKADPQQGFPGRTAEQYLVENEEIGKGTPNARLVEFEIKDLCPQHLPVLARARSGHYRKAPPLTTFASGKYTVGVEVAPGTYRSDAQVSDCYWERTDGAGTTIDNDYVTFSPNGVVVTVHTGEGFASERCGTWMKVG